MELWGASNADMRRDPRLAAGADVLRVEVGPGAAHAGRTPLRRIGYVAGIYKALQILYADPAQADGWVRRPNRHFGGQTPLERMAAGDVTDLAAVRAYVDAARTPWS